MPAEDAQPNEHRSFRSRLNAPIPRIAPPRYNPTKKRPAHNSFAGNRSPAKRRRLDHEFRQDIIRELPAHCQNTSHFPGAHNRRQAFVAREIANIQASPLGLRVVHYNINPTNVSFICVQTDITKVSLAPKSTLEAKVVESLRQQPEALKPPVASSTPSPDLASLPTGPVRSFRSGRLCFQVPTKLDSGTNLVPTMDDNRVAGLLSVDKAAQQSREPSLHAKESSPAVSADLPTPRSPSPRPSPSIPSLDELSELLPTVIRRSLSPLPFRQLEFVLDGEQLCFPIRHQHDKLRRLLLDPFDPSSSFTLSMHGYLQDVDIESRRHWSVDPATSRREFVEDACLLVNGDCSVTIVGHGRDAQQLSLIQNRRTKAAGTVTFTDLERPWNSLKKGGVSCVAPIKQPSLFASGGYDHNIHLWKLDDDLSTVSSRHSLMIRHNSLVQSILGVSDTSHKLASAGADCCVNFYDLSSQRVVNTLRTSNSVYHLHPTTSSFCTLFELAHRDFQFEVHDHRLVPSIPTLRFGYANPQVHGRYSKGASFSDYFASGDKEGIIRVWDLRNSNKPCCQIECTKGQRIAHIVSESSRLLVCSENNQISIIHRNSDV